MIGLPTQPLEVVYATCTDTSGSSCHVQLKGKTLGKPNAVRSPSSNSSAARRARGSACPMKIRLTGSEGSPPNPTPVNGQSSRAWPGRATETRGLGAGALTRAALSQGVPGPAGKGLESLHAASTIAASASSENWRDIGGLRGE